MYVSTFLNGSVLGFPIAAPGTVDILVIRRPPAGGRGRGFVSRVGAATFARSAPVAR